MVPVMEVHAQSSDKSFLIFCKALFSDKFFIVFFGSDFRPNDSLLYTQTQWQFRLTIKKKVVTRRDYNENDDGVDNDVYTKKTQWKRKYTNNHTSQTRLMHIVPGDTKLAFFQPKPF